MKMRILKDKKKPAQYDKLIEIMCDVVKKIFK